MPDEAHLFKAPGCVDNGPGVSTPRRQRVLTEPQVKALKMLAGGWEAVQRRGAVYEINGRPYQGPTLHSLAKEGLAEQFVLVPGEFPTHAYRVTEAGRQAARSITQ